MIVWKPDRLGRSLGDQLRLTTELEGYCVASHKVTERVDSIAARLKNDGFAARVST